MGLKYRATAIREGLDDLGSCRRSSIQIPLSKTHRRLINGRAYAARRSQRRLESEKLPTAMRNQAGAAAER
jgi:hypothetical protein